MTDLIYREGEIRKPKKRFELFKVSEPDEAQLLSKDGIIVEKPINAFLPVHGVKFHAFIIDSNYENLIFPDHPFCAVYLITHSEMNENYMVTQQDIDNFLPREFQWDNNSHITKDKFIIMKEFINPDDYYGIVNMDILRDKLIF